MEDTWRDAPQRRAELYLEALKRITSSGENDLRRFLLAECLESYAKIDEEERQRLESLLTTEKYLEVRPFMITTYERGTIDGALKGREEGIRQGKMEGKLEGQLETLLFMLETKFGPLSPQQRQLVEALSPDRMRAALVDLLKVSSWQELHLENGR